MEYLTFIFVSILLLVGFCLLTWQERKSGVRLLSSYRAQFDRRATRALFVVHHVDFAAFLRDEFRRILRMLTRVVAQLSLRAIRTVERLLIRLMHRFHLHHTAPQQTHTETREFVKTLSDFKGRLKETAPEMVPVKE